MRPSVLVLLQVTVCGILVSVEGKLKEGECEVCIKFMKKFEDTLTDDVKSNEGKIIEKLREACEKAKGKENRFCYYVGGTKDAATGMLKELARPMTFHKPVEKICESLKQKDGQICDLQYDKQIDLKNTNLKKLRVKQLKKILNDFDEECYGCVEKSDYVKKIEGLMKEHTEL